MNWIDECKLYFSGRLPTEATELENLLNDLGISPFDIAVHKFGKTGLDTYEAQRRIREALTYRCGAKVSIGGAIVSVLGAIVSWIRAFSG